jgi:hypothetical protein
VSFGKAVCQTIPSGPHPEGLKESIATLIIFQSQVKTKTPLPVQAITSDVISVPNTLLTA